MGIKPVEPQGLAADVRGAQDLRARMKTDPGAGLKSAAQEFEALFLQMMMKSMRATTSQDSLLDSDASRFFTGMLDQQVALNLSRSGGLGLAELLEQQLSRQLAESGGRPASISAAPRSELPLARPSGQQDRGASLQPPVQRAAAAPLQAYQSSPAQEVPQTPKAFVDQLWPHAVEASRITGIPPQFLVAHAALESGWGKRDIRNPDGSPSHNLFGIKAGRSWQGKTTEIVTTEYVDGQPVKTKESFRSYGSYAEAFQDYAQLLRGNPRYGAVIGSQDGTEFARRLQQAGYATDPRYAEKLAGIINGSTLRQALIG
ncbi:flagellar assembly peptidoglycan hydrolase FlgJ [Azovibrio restrictus]|uniref:flagellar assembly peptidoglycan hydrolase FlgJ n=1 Tax=Azovibrio restrictus TaxID=146938 RepID=UPI0026F22FED|nr:flagellar assembly peptidoglycan hydrolase FlgJ [Azovibrio restrictus]